jgi:hypothetical protein
MPTFEILYFAGCPAYRRARLNAQRAVAGSAADLKMVLVRHMRDAKALNFHGSPTVRLDGVDIDTEGLARFPEVGLYSRAYRWQGKEYDVPPEAMIRQRLATAAPPKP